MQTYTLLFEHPVRRGLEALNFHALSAAHAVQFARSLTIQTRCELWNDGRFVCALNPVASLGKRWMVVSGEVAVDIEVPVETCA